VQSLDTLGLKRRKSETVTPLTVAMVAHVSPDSTKSNRSQLETIPGRYGVGVAMPLPVVVGARDVVVEVMGVCPTMLTHT
jgi:hypothetical protein